MQEQTIVKDNDSASFRFSNSIAVGFAVTYLYVKLLRSQHVIYYRSVQCSQTRYNFTLID